MNYVSMHDVEIGKIYYYKYIETGYEFIFECTDIIDSEVHGKEIQILCYGFDDDGNPLPSEEFHPSENFYFNCDDFEVYDTSIKMLEVTKDTHPEFFL